MAMYTKSQQHNLLKGYNMLLYFAGSMISYEPSEECVADFWRNGILKKLPVSSSNPNFIYASSQLRNSCVDKSVCGKMLREDYIRLFTRQELPLAPAYGSLYIRKGKLNSDYNSSVSEFYNTYGWKSKFQGKINDDHLGVELLFLTVLIDKYLVMDDEACRGEMRNEIRRFIDYHILSWIPEWNKEIQSHANTLSYKGIGTLILACSEDIFTLLDQNTSTIFSTNNLKN
jgi:putative dimethyl sulfoxide reductase chaperone